MNVHSTAGAPSAGPEARGADKRDRILAAALRVFARAGVHGTPVPPIAKEAGVGVGTLYHYFDGKEAIVNAVFRDAKERLRSRLFDDLPPVEPSKPLFDELWSRLAAFATEDPETFQFLEMQDHRGYLDDESRSVEMRLLIPLRSLVQQGRRAGIFPAKRRPELTMALFWGAFVGVFKSQRLGYIDLKPADINAARDACWELLTGRGERGD